MPSALVVGVTGISGNNLARHLAAAGWDVEGVSRSAGIAVDITDAAATRAALADVRPTHLFFTTWSRQETEAENIRVNGAMLRNVPRRARRCADPTRRARDWPEALPRPVRGLRAV
jgi:nucleoside-diphosphate-sugar epimerase